MNGISTNSKKSEIFKRFDFNFRTARWLSPTLIAVLLGLAVYLPAKAFSWAFAQSEPAVTAETLDAKHILNVVRASSLRERGFLLALYAGAESSAGEGVSESDDYYYAPLYENDSIFAQPTPVLPGSTTAPGGEIKTHIVSAGETISSIAKLYNLKTETILWANNLSASSTLKVGQSIKILPVDGVTHRVRPGETLGAIALQYSADLNKVIAFNGMGEDGFIVDGQILIIPNGKRPAPPRQLVSKKSNGAETLVDVSGYFIKPATGRLTQGLHAYNAVDIGAPCGSPAYAAAGGTVTLADGTGYNGGYGRYLKISHPNGTQTLYSHLSKIIVSPNQTLEQGELIGLVGSTGRSTGCHVHFEVYGAANPFAKYR